MEDAAAYFVVAEALTNAAKHSGSQRVAVSLTRTRTGVRVVVRDEGKGGATTADGADAGGTGLSGMRRRVAALDGTCTTPPGRRPDPDRSGLPCAW